MNYTDFLWQNYFMSFSVKKCFPPQIDLIFSRNVYLYLVLKTDDLFHLEEAGCSSYKGSLPRVRGEHKAFMSSAWEYFES